MLTGILSPGTNCGDFLRLTNPLLLYHSQSGILANGELQEMIQHDEVFQFEKQPEENERRMVGNKSHTASRH